MAIIWNRVTWYSKLLAVILFLGVFALGFYLGGAYNQAAHPSSVFVMQVGSSTPPASTAVGTSTKPATVPKTSTPTSTPANPNEVRLTAYLTAYTYWDNTPPGSSQISNPIIHTLAGGTGTYSDPITVAVGHSITAGLDTLDYPAGTKFYVPNLRKYFIVEDTCGDGLTPQNGPCHTGYQGHPWLDLWIDGANGTKATSDACANQVTDLHLIIENPGSNYAVTPGPVYNNGCADQYGDTVVSAS